MGCTTSDVGVVAPLDAHRKPLAAWHRRVAGLTGLPGLVQELGGNPSALLQSARLDADALHDAGNCIPYAAFGRLLENAARQTRYPYLGLMAGRMCRLQDLGDLGEMVRHSDTLGAALEALVAYQHLQCEGGLLFLARRGAVAELGYAIFYPGTVGAGQIYDFVLAALFNMLRELGGPNWFPSEVFLPHARPDNVNHHRLLFRTQPRFDADFCALRFPAYWLDRRVENARTQNRTSALARVGRSGRPDFLQCVFRALRHALLNAKTSGDDVAHMLSMHRRTLNRRLREHGLTFRGVLDDVRLEVARQLLCESNASLDDIAAALGYAGVSGFMRRFKDQTGMTPALARRQARRAALELSTAACDQAPAPACRWSDVAAVAAGAAGAGEAARAAPAFSRSVRPTKAARAAESGARAPGIAGLRITAVLPSAQAGFKLPAGMHIPRTPRQRRARQRVS
jgi:AraC-like DNA-binding protein